MARVDLKNVTKDWGTAKAIDDISLSLENGEFAAVLGPSGCGKSTTLFMLAGIYLPTSGDILFDGARVNDVEARDRNVGIVFQSYALYPNMTVLQNITFPLRFKEISRADAERSAREIAELVEIEGLLDRRPNQLSGGQQQRVALARALVKKPNLLLLDEPLSNLDATLRLSMRTEIRRLQRELGVTTVLVTHDQIEAMTMADRIVCMNQGRIEQEGTPEALYSRPETVFAASFIGSPPMNLLAGEASDGGIKVGEAVLDTAGDVPPGAVKVGIRPEHITVNGEGVQAEILIAEPLGRETLYTARSVLGTTRFLEPTSVPRFKVGDQVRLGFEPEHTILFDGNHDRRLEGVRAHV
ncbi:ABC transporter ATP-binding protein [Roseibium aggregatum]|uniref:ABC transporter ATP-binding protein n=1 Tax=Roseibium aggregatum TaxID=187304 RepID=A0A939EGN1_9HYPH|nr:ABC transporter ATP-binding protein [Roseibium aggregatum]MBN9671858.1 ABC transporter ATP-binding protein [Roseibium aggregatum]